MAVGPAAGVPSFVERMTHQFDEWIVDHPVVDSDEVRQYTDLVPPAGSPIAQFGYRSDGTELTDSELDSILPSEPLDPFDARRRHG